MNNTMYADWSNMSNDVLDEIAFKLITFEDLFAFSVVCHSWYSAYMRVKHRWSPRMPWLMLPEKTEDYPADCCLRFFDPNTSKGYRLKLPKTFLCWGSAYGWIIGVDLKFNTFMFNPFTRARVELPSTHQLPSPFGLPRLGLPKWVDEDDPQLKNIKLYLQSVLDRIILLKIPTRSNRGEVVEEEFLAVSFGGENLVDISVAKPNDLTWTPILVEHNKRGHVSDVAYRNDGLLLLDNKGVVYRVELDHGALNNKPLIATYYSHLFGQVLNDPLHLSKLYLTKSSGSLLAVGRLTYFTSDAVNALEATDPFYDAQAFYVLKFNDEAKTWEHSKDLEGNSLFVGSNFTLATQACESSVTFRRNCIYFTDDLWPYWSSLKEFGRYDMGVFSIDDGSSKYQLSIVFEPSYHGQDLRAHFSCPLWFFPKF